MDSPIATSAAPSTAPSDVTRPRGALGGRAVRKPGSPSYEAVRKAIAKRSFAVLATGSPNGLPHAAGVVYAYVDGVLYATTDRTSRKAQNIAANQSVFVTIEVRRIPFGAPPSSIQFRATADLLTPDDPTVAGLRQNDRLKPISGHGEFDRPGICVVRITPGPVLHTYGLGMSLIALAKDPLNAAGRVERPMLRP